ncbi:uncharacterized protein MELLADRAFT_59280 [Melampsora larici-populina 98AG31]|uniref:Uncharacterized protein n=1 Tax=Melampsora larici-populina (strain 98AG31 / pathotype 3-4-7) TaxID=747676 RepID=F4R5P6_MELLP|nr:uncharacterized protein MELLADRAFT_59280 [Melampsora larici-populina 98AG31]EGG12226.1 hypothetical protein MELLADRAFT_59280 [Melampsora larici-populina 98AG31]
MSELPTNCLKNDNPEENNGPLDLAVVDVPPEDHPVSSVESPYNILGKLEPDPRKELNEYAKTYIRDEIQKKSWDESVTELRKWHKDYKQTLVDTTELGDKRYRIAKEAEWTFMRLANRDHYNFADTAKSMEHETNWNLTQKKKMYNLNEYRERILKALDKMQSSPEYPIDVQSEKEVFEEKYQGAQTIISPDKELESVEAWNKIYSLCKKRSNEHLDEKVEDEEPVYLDLNLGFK